MKSCRFKDALYNLLLELSGLNPAILNFYYDYFKNTVGRFPTLRELPGADSSKYLKEKLHISDNYVKIENLLNFTRTSSVEEALIKLNRDFNDLIIQITPISQTALIKFYPKVSKFSKPIYENLNLIASNKFIKIIDGKVQINEDLYLNSLNTGTLLYNPNKVYSEMLKEISAFNNINEFKPLEISDKIEFEYGIAEKNGNKNVKIFLKNQREKGFFELQKDKELGFYTVHFKTATEKFNYTNAVPSTKTERSYLYDALLACLPPGACISTWGDISEGGIQGLNKLGKSLNKVGERLIKLKSTNNPVVINIYQKPSNYEINILPKEDLQKIQNMLDNKNLDLANNLLILDILNKVLNLLGVQTVPITSKAIMQDSELSKIPNIKSASAFIYNNQIYINTDLASTDSATHELLHLLLGSLKANNYEYYFSMVDKASQFPSFQKIARKYFNRSNSDILEEVFVEEVAKWLNGEETSISFLNELQKYDILFNIFNMLDMIINGSESAETFNELKPLEYSFKQLAAMLNTRSLNSEDIVENSSSQRALSNLKEQLIKNNQLKEIC